MSTTILAWRASVDLPCPVRGHGGHPLDQVDSHVQDGTGLTAVTVECPRNHWRWFLVEGRTPKPANRIANPDHGRWTK